MFKKTFLFITTILTATSVSTGYGSTDSLKGSVDAATFLDWFNNAEKYVHINGLIVLDIIPALFLIIQAILFFKDSKKLKGLFCVLAVLANLIGVFLVIKYANPIASQIAGWTSDKLPSDWISLKDNWLKYIGLYGLIGILGWLCFVITYAVVGVVTNNRGLAPATETRNFYKFTPLFYAVVGVVTNNRGLCTCY